MEATEFSNLYHHNQVFKPNLNMLRNLFILSLVILVSSASATTRKVLFLGNSYTYTNNLPLMLQQMASSMGDTLVYDENTIGGYTLQDHCADAISINKISAQAWDIVVLQEQSQRPAFDPTQVATDTYPYARKLDSLIRKHSACTETMFYMTWGYKNGDGGNCAAYPPICTYGGMQQRLRDSYLQMAKDNNAVVSPVGAAWKQVRDSFPVINLYNPDESHPVAEGTYLAACVFYASIFHKNPAKTTYTAGITTANAANLSRIAGRIVLDSFSKWNQYGNYTYANFTKSVLYATATLTNVSASATNYAWTFGDGATSTTASPVHIYSKQGTFPVTLTASNTCFSEMHMDSVTTYGLGINTVEQENNIKMLNIGEGSIRIVNTSDAAYTAEIIDMNGRVVERFVSAAQSHQDLKLAPGTYACMMRSGDMLMKRKLVVY